MIKNCLMNFMLVLPVFSSDCRGRAGSQTAWGTGLASGTGLVRIAEASWSARAAQAARIGATNNYILVCGFVKMKLRNSAETEKKTRSRFYLHHEFPDQKLSDLIGNQPLDSDLCSHHECPDLIFSKPCGKFDTVKVSRSRYSTRYDSLKDINTVYLGTVFLCAVNIL